MSGNTFDKQASTPDRLRRAMQKLGTGAITGTIKVSSPLSNNGSTLGLSLLTGGGLKIATGGLGMSTALATAAPLTGGGDLSTGLTITLPQVSSTTSGWISSTQYNALTAQAISTSIATTAPLTGGGATSTNLTLAIPAATSTTNGYLTSTDWVAFHSGGATPIIAADASIVVGSSTGSTTLKVQETATGGISTAGTGIGILLGSTSGSTALVDVLFSTYAASTNLYTIGGNGSTWWTVTGGAAGGFSIGSTLNSTCLQTLHNYAQSISTSGQFYVGQYVPALSLGTHYQVTAVVRNDNGKASGTAASVGFHVRLPATGTATSTSGMALAVYADALWLYQNWGNLLASTAVSIGGADHTVMLDVNGDTFTIFLDGVSQFSSTSSHDSGNSGVGLFAGWLTQGTSTGVKEFKISTVTASPTYSGLQLAASGLSILPDPNGGLTVLSTGIGVHGFSTVAADPASPADGQAWYNSTSQTPKVEEKGVKLGMGGLLYINTSDSATLTNITTFTQFNTSTSLPANFLTVGKVVRIVAAGQISTGAAEQVTVALLVGGLGIQMPNFVTAGASTLNWQLTLTTVCRTTGSTGTVSQIAEGVIEPNGTTTGAAFVVSNQTGTLDTTNTFFVGAEFAATLANNTAFCRHLEVEVVN